MKMTSAQAAKELRLLKDQFEALQAMENKSREFIVAIQEDVEKARPDYDFSSKQDELNAIEDRIRALKHSINQFNISQTVPGFDMTIDQMLVYIPQLTGRKKKLDHMRKRLPRERAEAGFGRSSNVIEYKYANYDIAQAESAYKRTAEELTRAQNALDAINNTVEFDVNI